MASDHMTIEAPVSVMLAQHRRGQEYGVVRCDPRHERFLVEQPRTLTVAGCSRRPATRVQKGRTMIDLEEQGWAVKARHPGEKIFYFITPQGGETRLRIHAGFSKRGEALRYVEKISALNPDVEFKAVRLWKKG